MKSNQWAPLLPYVTGLVNQELLLQNEHRAAENRIMRAHLAARLGHARTGVRCTRNSSAECFDFESDGTQKVC